MLKISSPSVPCLMPIKYNANLLNFRWILWANLDHLLLTV